MNSNFRFDLSNLGNRLAFVRFCQGDKLVDDIVADRPITYQPSGEQCVWRRTFKRAFVDIIDRARVLELLMQVSRHLKEDHIGLGRMGQDNFGVLPQPSH